MIRTPLLEVSNAALGGLVLQQASDASRLLDACCMSPDQVRTARGLSFAVQGGCQALMTVGAPEYERKIVIAIVGHLERAAEALAGQMSTAARLTARAIATTVAMVEQMDGLDWEMDDDE